MMRSKPFIETEDFEHIGKIEAYRERIIREMEEEQEFWKWYQETNKATIVVENKEELIDNQKLPF